jgi:hypothetical protein
MDETETGAAVKVCAVLGPVTAGIGDMDMAGIFPNKSIGCREVSADGVAGGVNP